VEQAAVARFDFGVAEFPMRRCLDLAAELRRHGLHAIADAQHGNAEFEYRLRGSRRIVEIDGLRTAREDDAIGPERPEILVRHIPGVNLGVDPDLAHAPGDQLGVLAAEIEDQQPVGVDIDPRVRHVSSSSGNSALPW
jgi:hypothetical protein